MWPGVEQVAGSRREHRCRHLVLSRSGPTVMTTRSGPSRRLGQPRSIGARAVITRSGLAQLISWYGRWGSASRR